MEETREETRQQSEPRPAPPPPRARRSWGWSWGTPHVRVGSANGLEFVVRPVTLRDYVLYWIVMLLTFFDVSCYFSQEAMAEYINEYNRVRGRGRSHRRAIAYAYASVTDPMWPDAVSKMLVTTLYFVLYLFGVPITVALAWGCGLPLAMVFTMPTILSVLFIIVCWWAAKPFGGLVLNYIYLATMYPALVASMWVMLGVTCTTVMFCMLVKNKRQHSGIQKQAVGFDLFTNSISGVWECLMGMLGQANEFAKNGPKWAGQVRSFKELGEYVALLRAILFHWFNPNALFMSTHNTIVLSVVKSKHHWYHSQVDGVLPAVKGMIWALKNENMIYVALQPAVAQNFYVLSDMELLLAPPSMFYERSGQVRLRKSKARELNKMKKKKFLFCSITRDGISTNTLHDPKVLFDVEVKDDSGKYGLGYKTPGVYSPPSYDYSFIKRDVLNPTSAGSTATPSTSGSTSEGAGAVDNMLRTLSEELDKGKGKEKQATSIGLSYSSFAAAFCQRLRRLYGVRKYTILCVLCLLAVAVVIVTIAYLYYRKRNTVKQSWEITYGEEKKSPSLANVVKWQLPSGQWSGDVNRAKIASALGKAFGEGQHPLKVMIEGGAVKTINLNVEPHVEGSKMPMTVGQEKRLLRVAADAADIASASGNWGDITTAEELKEVASKIPVDSKAYHEIARRARKAKAEERLTRLTDEMDAVAEVHRAELRAQQRAQAKRDRAATVANKERLAAVRAERDLAAEEHAAHKRARLDRNVEAKTLVKAERLRRGRKGKNTDKQSVAVDLLGQAVRMKAGLLRYLSRLTSKETATSVVQAQESSAKQFAGMFGPVPKLDSHFTVAEMALLYEEHTPEWEKKLATQGNPKLLCVVFHDDVDYPEINVEETLLAIQRYEQEVARLDKAEEVGKQANLSIDAADHVYQITIGNTHFGNTFRVGMFFLMCKHYLETFLKLPVDAQVYIGGFTQQKRLFDWKQYVAMEDEDLMFVRVPTNCMNFASLSMSSLDLMKRESWKMQYFGFDPNAGGSGRIVQTLVAQPSVGTLGEKAAISYPLECSAGFCGAPVMGTGEDGLNKNTVYAVHMEGDKGRKFGVAQVITPSTLAFYQGLMQSTKATQDELFAQSHEAIGAQRSA